MYKVLCFLIIVSFLGIGSCKKKATDPDYCATSWATQLSAEVNALSTAAQAYGASQTAANCNAFKTAYQNYLNALDPFLDCAAWTVQERSELQDAIDEAQQDINNLVCQ
jgi:hypothetical protein